MGTAARIEVSAPNVYVVQYACCDCGQKVASALEPRLDPPVAEQTIVPWRAS